MRREIEGNIRLGGGPRRGRERTRGTGRLISMRREIEGYIGLGWGPRM